MKVLISLITAALVLPAAADIIILKDGTRLDAEILKKTLEEYELEVRVTKSIKERRTIKRSEVAEIEAVNESDTIFEARIAKLAPAPPFLEQDEYDSRIKTIESFLLAHELTSAGTKAKRMLKELKAEREVIAAGGIKTSNEPSGLLSAAEREKNRLALDAHLAAEKFKSAVKANALLNALRFYEQLELNYFGTQAHREAYPLAKTFVTQYTRNLTSHLNGLEAAEERRKEGFARMSASEQERVLNAEAQRRANYERLWNKEEENGQYWLSVDMNDIDSVEKTLEALEKEMERLDKLAMDLSEAGDMGELFQKGWVLAGEKNKEALEIILEDLEKLGASESYLNQLIDRFDPTINNPPPTEENETGEDAKEGSEEDGENESPE